MRRGVCGTMRPDCYHYYSRIDSWPRSVCTRLPAFECNWLILSPFLWQSSFTLVVSNDCLYPVFTTSTSRCMVFGWNRDACVFWEPDVCLQKRLIYIQSKSEALFHIVTNRNVCLYFEIKCLSTMTASRNFY